MQLQLASTQQAHARQDHALSRVNASRNSSRSGFSASSAAAAAAAAAGMPSVIGPSNSGGSGMQVITGSGMGGPGSAIPVLGGVSSAANSTHHLGHSHHHMLTGDRGSHGHHPHPLQSVSGLSGASDSSSSVSSLGASAFNFGTFGVGGAPLSSQGGSGSSTAVTPNSSSFLLRQLSDEESGDDASKAEAELAKVKKSQFVQELVISTLVREHMHIDKQTFYRQTEPGGKYPPPFPPDDDNADDNDIYDRTDKGSVASDSDCL